MSRVGEFTRYIGLVVLLSAVVLLAPRLTVSAWVGFTRGCRDRWHRARAWRPGTVAAEPAPVPVDVRVGDRRASDPDEVLEHHGFPDLVSAVRELWALAREAVEAGALTLALAGVALRTASALVQQLPEPVVLGSDLLLVLGAFLLLQRIVRDYPAGMLAPYLRPSAARASASGPAQARSRARHLLEMAVLAPGFLVLIAWPAEIGRFVAEKQFSGPQSTVLVVWACELPWFLALTWFLARPLLPRRAPARHSRSVRPTAPVLEMHPAAAVAEERRAA